MKDEASFKTAFRKSLLAARGFSLALAAPMLAGIPDIYAICPHYMPVLLEAKWLKDVNAHNFNRKINYSALQKLWIKSACDVQEYAAMGLIGFKFKDKTYAVLVYSGIDNINYGFQTIHPFVIYDKGFDIPALFKQSRVPQMPLTVTNFYANANVLLKDISGIANAN